MKNYKRIVTGIYIVLFVFFISYGLIEYYNYLNSGNISDQRNAAVSFGIAIISFIAIAIDTYRLLKNRKK
jgi:hypothetical protein